jgi:hypothetical protein
MEGSNDECGDGSGGVEKENGMRMYAGEHAANNTR